ncbi:acyltransferase [Bacteriovorax sp. BSW11_IV]|uniref:lysophospholipid acyltransferase family protein n=1 Tax=Bacteriovorax sp. BSW11_IV TaxID=1353529 RepID=UPI000389DAA4|nr:lysophospholipid acyltransferase family protein [Bacteriovorax sp. BSW11_IV]EQC49534.1 acyltransferase [Bacteriovorax sp. BSW11_IV]
MIEQVSKIFSKLKMESEDNEKVDQSVEELLKKYPNGEDPWGLNLEKARRNLEYIYPIYKNYFKVRLFGKENVNDRPYIVVSNHTGQIAIDGMLISTAFATEIRPARVLRSMVERFFTGLPFIGLWAQQGGAVLGDRHNCMQLLQKGESILVFPEGVRGVSKSTKDFYKLQKFTRGFFRMALSSGTTILPVAVVGAEEVFPYVVQASGLAKKLGLPALPLSANYFPLPSPIDIHIGEEFPLPKISPDATDREIDEHIYEIERRIKELIDRGLENRRPFFANQVTESRKKNERI